MKNNALKKIVRGSAIAAAYVVLTGPFAIFSFGAIQVRLAEALTILPFFWPEAIAGLAVGCFISNLLWSPFGVIDWTLGTFATLLAATLTFLLSRTKKIWLGAIPPIVINGLVVGLYVSVLQGFFDIGIPQGLQGFTATFTNFKIGAYMVVAGQVMLGEAVALGVLGVPLAYVLKRTGFLNEGL